MSAHISIVIPALNEEESLPITLAAQQPLRQQGHEIVVVDGGSSDRTMSLAHAGADIVIQSESGRARQMNAGARAATARTLLFLHADTRLPPSAVDAVMRALQRHAWGRFDVRLSGSHPLLRAVEIGMNWRSRVTGIATGDQAMFMRREAFETVGGFPDIKLMEDIALSTRLRAACGMPACVRDTVITSSRRWEQRGIARTILKMWYLRAAYALGVSADSLARRHEAR